MLGNYFPLMSNTTPNPGSLAQKIVFARVAAMTTIHQQNSIRKTILA